MMKATGLGLALCVTMTGCFVAVEEGDSVDAAGSEGNVATVQEPLLAGWATGPFAWSQGQPTRLLEPADTHVCVLTRLSGKFRGGGESVQVTRSDDGTRWVLRGASAQQDVSGEATCFKRSDFTATGATRAVGAYESNVWTRTVETNCVSRIVDTALSDTFVFLQGLEGQLAGGGEYALVEQSLSTSLRTRLQVQTCVPGNTLTAFVLSYRVGNQGRLATFMNAKGGRGDLYDVPEFVATGNSSVKMAPASKALCAFTRIQGEFQGGGEAVQIRVEDSNWVMRTSQGAASEFMRAHARCFARAQAD